MVRGPMGRALNAKLPVFPIACWGLGLVVFCQMLVGGMALAARLEESKQVRVVEKTVERFIPIERPVKPAAEEEASVVARPPVAVPPPVVEPAPDPRPIVTPEIADPESERMVKEARKARVGGDMGLAIVKLEESLKLSPEDPSVHYEMGLVFEAMGVFDQASAHFEKVFQMGVSGAGALYELAATKLRDGFEQPGDYLGKLALGRVRIFKDTRVENGERVVLTIPVQKSPGTEVDPADISVEVRFFNRTSKGEIVKLEDNSWAQEEWPSLPFDFEGGEEPLRVTYTIPARDLRTSHLFGQEKYYGQVVTLYYKGEILDLHASPRDLAGRVNAPPAVQQGGFLQDPAFDQLPPDFNPDVPLLPTPDVPPIDSLPLEPGR